MKYKDFYKNLNELLNVEENQALKNFYVHITDILQDLVRQRTVSTLDTNNFEAFKTWFLEKYRPVMAGATREKASLWHQNTEGVAIEFTVPVVVQESFPAIGYLRNKNALHKKFELILSNNLPKNTGAACIISNKRIVGILLNLSDLTDKKFNEYKSVLQHEIQHTAMSAQDLDKTRDIGDKNYSEYKYYYSAAEIEAFAKQYAYMYHKKFPKDTRVNSEKLLDFIYNNSLNRHYNNLYAYLVMFQNPQKHKSDFGTPISYAEMETMRQVHLDFVRELTRSLNYFIRVDSTKLEESMQLDFPITVSDEQKNHAREALKFYIKQNYNYYSNAEQNLKSRYAFKLERVKDNRWGEIIYTFNLVGKGGNEYQFKSYPDAIDTTAGRHYGSVKDAIESIPHDENSAYRGMSFEEALEAKRRGYFKSKGELNLGSSQAGYTFFGEDPSTAIFYASGFQPIVSDVTRNKPGVIIQVSKDILSPADLTPNKARTGPVGTNGEWITANKIPCSEVQNMWFILLSRSTYATIEVVYNRYSKTYSSGSRFPASKKFVIINKKDFLKNSKAI